MKRIFLLFGLAVFGSASAQQKDVFDIQKHLLQKTKEQALKQNPAPFPYINKGYLTLPPASNIFTLANGDNVIFGNGAMPVIKPPMNQFKTMPNLSDFDKSFTSAYLLEWHPGQMPNVSVPSISFSIK